MTSTITGLKQFCVLIPIVTLSMLGSGCAAPPSVAPLLRVAGRSLGEESQRLISDAERDRAHMQQSLGLLEDAFVRDLEQAPQLNPQWVRDATVVYVAAREALIRHEQTLAQERGNRAANLRSAGAAINRAVSMIEQQDRLLRGVTGSELRSLLELPVFTFEEPTP